MSKRLIDRQGLSSVLRNGSVPLTCAVFLMICLTGGCSNMHGTNTPVRASEPSADTSSRHRQSVQLMQGEQWQSAVDMLEEITAAEPALSGPWLNLGIAYTKTGNGQGAEDAFKHAIDVNTENVEAYNQLGILYRRTGRTEQAQFIYETALKLDPDNSSLHWNLAILHDTDLPDPRKALLHYQRYRQITGSDDPQLRAWIRRLEEHSPATGMTARMNP